jgi:hypothetical protein
LGVPRPEAEIDIADSQLDELGYPEPVPRAEEDHRVIPGGVALALLRRAEKDNCINGDEPMR